MSKDEAAMLAYLLIFSITTMASGGFGLSGGKVMEVKSQEELSPLASKLDWSNNNTTHVMVPTLSQGNSTSPINESTDLQTDALPSLKQKVRDIQGKNLTTERSTKGDDVTLVALRSNKNNKYVQVFPVRVARNVYDYVAAATGDIVDDSGKFQLIDLGNDQVAIKCYNGGYLRIFRPNPKWIEYVTCRDPDTAFD